MVQPPKANAPLTANAPVRHLPTTIPPPILVQAGSIASGATRPGSSRWSTATDGNEGPSENVVLASGCPLVDPISALNEDRVGLCA